MTHCPRCGGRLTANIDGDLVCWQCGAVLYERHGYTLPAVRTGRVRRVETGGRKKRER
jgi:uncharacterized Zn finger protein (UPF0148 family)